MRELRDARCDSHCEGEGDGGNGNGRGEDGKWQVAVLYFVVIAGGAARSWQTLRGSGLFDPRLSAIPPASPPPPPPPRAPTPSSSSSTTTTTLLS
jgi:hypothetical protein